jgi:glucuronosyltransferase
MPKTVMAGLMTCRPGLPLPPDLAAFVEGAEHGVIFVSFGSVIKSSKMPEDKRQLLLSLFSSLKQRIIWKWEAAMPDAPPNVMVSSWLPQQDLLAHPKVTNWILK